MLMAWVLIRARLAYSWLRFNLGRWVNVAALVLLAFLGLELVFHYYGLEIMSKGTFWLQVLFFLIMSVSSWHHFRAWRDNLQEVYFIEAAAQISQVLSSVATLSGYANGNTLREMLKIVRKNFERKGPINVNVFLFDSSAGGLVFRAAFPPEANVDRTLLFPPGIGGAGTAYSETAVVYIPWRSHGAALVQAFPGEGEVEANGAYSSHTFSVIQSCAVPDKVESFESVLTVPVMFRGKCFGVLNLDSDKRDAFRTADFRQARFYGVVLGAFLNE